MKKRISFFNVISNIFISIGLFITMVLISFCLVSLTYFNKNNSEISYLNDIDIYQPSKIKNFNIHKNNTTYIIYIDTIKKETNTFLMEYGLHYYDLFKSPIYLEGFNYDTSFYVTIDDNKTISIIA